MRSMSEAETGAFWERLEQEVPTLWIRAEVGRLEQLLETHISLALESGTEPARVVALLKRVRAAILDTRGQS